MDEQFDVEQILRAVPEQARRLIVQLQQERDEAWTVAQTNAQALENYTAHGGRRTLEAIIKKQAKKSIYPAVTACAEAEERGRALTPQPFAEALEAVLDRTRQIATELHALGERRPFYNDRQLVWEKKHGLKTRRKTEAVHVRQH